MKIEIIKAADNNPVAEFFSSRSTPETDANEAWPATKLRLGNDGVVPADFARRLERQRDEAREALSRIEEVFIDGCDTCADREKMGSIARAALEETK